MHRLRTVRDDLPIGSLDPDPQKPGPTPGASVFHGRTNDENGPEKGFGLTEKINPDFAVAFCQWGRPLMGDPVHASYHTWYSVFPGISVSGISVAVACLTFLSNVFNKRIAAGATFNNLLFME